jgi:hypothetical protein
MSSNVLRLSTIALVLAACSKDTPGVTTPPRPTVSQLQVVSGAGQVSKPGAVLAESLVVRAVTSTGAPVSGVAITWAANASAGTISPSQSKTDSTGRAAAQWTLGQGNTDSVTATTGSVTARFGARAVTSSSQITWTVETSGTTHNLNAVWGSSGSNVYAVGDSGAFLHYDGTSWSQVQDSIISARSTQPAFTIWGSSATDVYSANSTLIHFDGQKWSGAVANTIPPGTVGVYGVWGDSPSDVWLSVNLGGENVFQYDGSHWNYQVIPPDQPGSPPIYCPTSWFIAGLSSTDIFNYDFCGSFYSFDGTTWRVYSGYNSVTTYPWAMSAMWAVPGNAIYAIGGNSLEGIQRGVYVASSPTSWALVPGSPTLPITNLATGSIITTQNGLWGDAANDLFAAVNDTVYHYDGTTWSRQGDPSWHGWAMYGPSLADIFVVGPHGFILHGRR